MPPTVVITRPEAAGLRFADQLRERLGCGVVVELSPLMRIENIGDLPDLGLIRTLIFTSGNGVQAYAAMTDRRDIPCYCTGDATALAARNEGMVATSCAGTADDLVARILADRTGGPCLHIRGEHGVGDVANRLRDAGVMTDQAILYRQVPQPASPAADALLRGEAPVILPLFSPRSARIVFAVAEVSAPVTIVALSPNVAAALPATFSGAVIVAHRPDVAAMLDAVERVIAKGEVA